MIWMNSKGPLTSAMDNVLAWRMGEACRAAAAKPGGDLIDQGLILLHLLNESGFEVTYSAALEETHRVRKQPPG